MRKTTRKHPYRRALGHGVCQGAVWSAAVALGACASPADVPASPTERSATVSAALTPTVLDENSPDADVVVVVGTPGGNCTGTLITPQIVLTANHCIWGGVDSSSNTCSSSALLRTVNIGSSVSALRSVGSIQAETVTNGCQPAGSRVNDLGLLYLRVPVTGALFLEGMRHLVPRVVRPLLSEFTETPGGSFGVAGWGGFAVARRSASPGSLAAMLQGSFIGIAEDSGHWDTENGDSGGPLFYRHADGHREVVGALYGKVDDFKVWSSVVQGAGAGWVADHVKESNVPDSIPGSNPPRSLRHTPQWLAYHGKTGDSWWGEVDYSGPCQTHVDRDCDGWWDQGGMPIHDNCMSIANPDQLDANNNGFGDACDPCAFGTDEDEDGICAPLAPTTTSLNKADNCPTIKNHGRDGTMGQQNCNEKSEEVRRRDPSSSIEILGDACDPVPCPQPKPRASGEYRYPVGGGHPMFGGFLSGRIITDDIDTLRVAPHKKTGGAGRVPMAVPLGETGTLGRFCQQNEDLLYDCTADRQHPR